MQLNTYEQANNEEIRAWEEEIAIYTEKLNNCKEYKSEMKSQKSSGEMETDMDTFTSSVLSNLNNCSPAVGVLPSTSSIAEGMQVTAVPQQ